MELLKNIKKEDWTALIKRPCIEQEQLTSIVRSILETVKSEKDLALKKYALLFDKVSLNSLKVSKPEIEKATSLLSPKLKKAINLAKLNIEKFHRSQQSSEAIIETTPGVKCWRKNIAIEKVGLYIPGGSAPLFSTILILPIFFLLVKISTKK